MGGDKKNGICKWGNCSGILSRIVGKDNIIFLKEREFKSVFQRESIYYWKKKICTIELKLLRIYGNFFWRAMSYIDPDKRGYDDIFAYFDEYVNFEELIFASDSFIGTILYIAFGYIFLVNTLRKMMIIKMF